MLQKLTKSYKSELRHFFQCCILIAKKCPRKTPFQHTVAQFRELANGLFCAKSIKASICRSYSFAAIAIEPKRAGRQIFFLDPFSSSISFMKTRENVLYNSRKSCWQLLLHALCCSPSTLLPLSLKVENCLIYGS